MAYKIKWSSRAASNFEDICNYIGKDSKYYASLFAKKVTALIKAIPQFPKSGRIVPEYGDENIRHDYRQGHFHEFHRHKSNDAVFKTFFRVAHVLKL